MLKTYKELKVWGKSYSLCLDIYKLSKKFPDIEKFGLTSQLRRASVSIPSNIAEGYGRKTTKEYIYSLFVANGSVCELETQLMLAKDLKYINNDDFILIDEKLSEVERMLKALIKSLEQKK